VEEGDGKRLNQYAIGQVLVCQISKLEGKGSFGTVYLGFDENLKKSVAIKEFSKTKLRKEKAKKSGTFLGIRGRGRGRGASTLGRGKNNKLKNSKYSTRKSNRIGQRRNCYFKKVTAC
jgi:serine/threonine protein kinase